MKRFSAHRPFWASLILVVIFSCTTEKNTLMTRSFHNLTSHYNVYFNGNEALKSYMLRVDEIPEDYTSILPIFKESMPEAREVTGSDMLTAVEKGEKLIKYHSITKPPKKKKSGKRRKAVKREYNNWVDDAYIMMGKAQLYSGDYIQAENIFSQVVRLYKDEPAKYDAYIWLIRTYAEAERYTEAAELVSSLEGDDKLPEELGGELAIVAADLYLKQARYEEAIQYLNIGIKKIKGNKRKTRYTFVLAQLYREIGQNEKSLAAFQQVIRRRPNYEMQFNARIMSAQVLSGSENSAMLRKELNKMRRNKRNQPYLDQIYYALGNIFFSEGKVNQAIDQYRLSVTNAVRNTHQRALSSITLGDIYFNQKVYQMSAAYYDSAFAVMNPEYPDYERLNKRYTNLSQLVGYLNTVTNQDSLQQLASLSKEELDQKIKAWIGQANADIARQNASESSSQYGSSMYMAQGSRMRINSGSSSWYFYNPSTVSFGKKEYQRLWGDRKNEDNWRRKNKAVSMDNEAEEVVEEENMADALKEKEQELATDPTKPEYYTQNIPKSDSLMQASHLMIRDALFNAGGLFKTEFEDEPSAIKCYQELNRRYPSSIYHAQSLFYLYDLYTEIQKPDSAALYKDQIMSLYPESNFSKFLINPNYFTELEMQRDSINRLYASAFNAYRTNNFASAAQLSRKVSQLATDTAMVKKARFIEMISKSRALPRQTFSDSLQAYINQYPSGETSQLASEILALLKEETLSNYQELVKKGYLNDRIQNPETVLGDAGNSTAATPQSKWDTDSKLLHYFVIAFPNDEAINLNRLKFDIANYNLDHYTSLDFEIETEVLNNDTKLIVVRHLDSKENALIYFLSIIRKPEVFKTLAGQKFYNFVVSNNNFREMMRDQNFEEYLQFFVKNYSKFTTGEFPDDAYETPEAMMAKLKAKENELKERGEFVVVAAPDSAYVPPVAPELKLFDVNYEAPHEFIVYVPQQGYQTAFLMRSLMQTNNREHRNKRLRVMPTVLKTGPVLAVSSFQNAADATAYSDWATEHKDLFRSLANTPYKTFVISTDNLNKLKQNNEIDAYQKFYQQAYVQNRRVILGQNQEPKSEQSVTKPEEKPAVKAEEKPVAKGPEVMAPAVASASDTLKTAAAVQPTKAAEEKPVVTDVPKAAAKTPDSKPEPATVQPQSVPKVEEKEVAPNQQNTVVEPTPTVAEKPATVEAPYNGPYSFKADEKHYVVVVVPAHNFNKMILMTNVTRFNSMRYRNNNLQATMGELSPDINMLTIETGDKDFSVSYLKALNADPRHSQSLRNVIHKSFVISESNLEILKTLKNPAQYEEFFKRFY